MAPHDDDASRPRPPAPVVAGTAASDDHDHHHDDSERAALLARSVDELELSIRTANCLQNAGVETIGDLVQKTEADLFKTKNFGRKSLKEIQELLAGMGLQLGM